MQQFQAGCAIFKKCFDDGKSFFIKRIRDINRIRPFSGNRRAMLKLLKINVFRLSKTRSSEISFSRHFRLPSMILQIGNEYNGFVYISRLT
ncbi:MAG: hypothetical protein C4530_22710 [Desulfobacteraceae bacterium]|nr:MAG: hypothetical protein C4530_22710 [Desulfobacteraceae bacterium]